MTQIAHDGAEVIVSRGQGSPNALSRDEQAYDESRELMRPFDPGIAWEQGGKEFCEASIRVHASAAAECMIEIGKALIWAKSQLDHGQWRDWLAEQGLSKDSAARSIALANRMADHSALRGLSKTKAVALLGMSDEQLDELNDKGVVETLKLSDIEKMSARELQSEITKLRARDEKGKKQVDDLKKKIDSLEGELNTARGLAPDADDRFLALVGRFSIDLDEFRSLIRETKDSASATRVWAMLLREIRSIRADNVEHIFLGALVAAGDVEGEDELVDELEDAELRETDESLPGGGGPR